MVSIVWRRVVRLNEHERVPGQRCNPNIVRVSRLSERPD